jgi:large subunit ribosomal protein L18
MTRNTDNRDRRHKRIRAKISGTAERPRLAVFKSNTRISAQLIDDTAAITIASYGSDKISTGTTLEKAVAVGKEIAAQANKKGVTAAVFDRGGFQYIGQVKALADGAREGGLTF